jgi:hypothetical protein
MLITDRSLSTYTHDYHILLSSDLLTVRACGYTCHQGGSLLDSAPNAHGHLADSQLSACATRHMPVFLNTMVVFYLIIQELLW